MKTPVNDQPNAPAEAAVSAVGSAEGHMRLPTEAHRPGAAVTTLHMEPTLINELRH